jgi:hypothetical protein
MRRRFFVAATGTALATVGLASCTGDGTEPGTTDTETTADSTDTETSDGEFDPIRPRARSARSARTSR